MFERFYRVDKSHSSGGTGLGLSIVKHGAAYLGARVELHSEPGRGSTFTLTFPRRDVRERNRAAHPLVRVRRLALRQFPKDVDPEGDPGGEGIQGGQALRACLGVFQ